MSDIVFAASTCHVGWHGSTIFLRQGDAWAADDPFVRARPEFFVTGMVHRTTPAPPVEQATAAPGEKRQVKRG